MGDNEGLIFLFSVHQLKRFVKFIDRSNSKQIKDQTLENHFRAIAVDYPRKAEPAKNHI